MSEPESIIRDLLAELMLPEVVVARMNPWRSDEVISRAFAWLGTDRTPPKGPTQADYHAGAA